jgi:hypothetical protein
MSWSIGKDSTVLQWLAGRAFFGHIPFPLVPIETSFKLPEMIDYRDRLAREYRLQMVVGENRTALDAKTTFPDMQSQPEGHPSGSRASTAAAWLTNDALVDTLNGTLPRKRPNLTTGQYPLRGGAAFGRATGSGPVVRRRFRFAPGLHANPLSTGPTRQQTARAGATKIPPTTRGHSEITAKAAPHTRFLRSP